MRFDRAAVELMLADIKRVVATRGPAIRDVALPQTPIDDAAKLIMGPTGNLRAPALRIGRTLVVGYSVLLYSGFLK